MIDPIGLAISLSDKKQPIPYSGSESGYHYISLLEWPEAVNDFPELKGEPTMISFLLGINSPGWTFETARITHGFFDGENDSVIRRTAIGIFFRDRTLFERYSNCMMFAGNLLLAAQNGTVESDQEFLLEIQPLILRQERLCGWVMDVYFAGRGSSKDAAKNRLDQLLRHSLPFFQTGGAPSPSIPSDS